MRWFLTAMAFLLCLAIIVAVVGPAIGRSILQGYEASRQGDTVETMPVVFRLFPGTPHEQDMSGSSLIEYKGEIRMIVARERGQYVIDDIHQISSSISSLSGMGSYCVDLPKPQNEYDGMGIEMLTKAEGLGLKIGCGSKIASNQACPSDEIAGVEDHPFSAIETDVFEDIATHKTSSITYKMGRDASGRLYTYREQEEDGIKRNEFAMDDPSDNSKSTWIDGDDKGQVVRFEGAGHPRSKLVSVKFLGNKIMEGLPVEGNDVTCTVGQDSQTRYEAWASEKLGSYVDLITTTAAMVEHRHLEKIDLGSTGVNFFLPPAGLKFEEPAAANSED